MDTMIYDLTIIGGGPAGVGAGVYAVRKRLKTLFITKDWDAQSSVSESIENWIGTVKISGTNLAKSLENHLRAYAGDSVEIHTGEICTEISKKSESPLIFSIKTSKASGETLEYEAKSVLITTGSSRRKLDVKGADIFEHKGLTYCASCDGPLFANMDVAVIGGGNAAFESTSQLSAYCKTVYILNRGDKFRADEVTVNRVSEKSNVKIIKNALPEEVKGDKFVSGLIYKDSVSGESKEIPLSGIFVEIGAIPATSFASKLLEMDQTGHVMVDPKNQRTKTLGIWSAGDCTDGLYHQNNIAVGDGVKALEDIYLFLHAGK
ncbi:MAG: FAD-dependent oxidoreductase [bacterium]|nr:FAD-dependent oxidoreductase [bacterium]